MSPDHSTASLIKLFSSLRIYCELLIFGTTCVALKNPNVLSKRYLHGMRGDSWTPHLEIPLEKFIIDFFKSLISIQEEFQIKSLNLCTGSAVVEFIALPVAMRCCRNTFSSKGNPDHCSTLSLLLRQQINSSTLLVVILISDFEILLGGHSHSVSQSRSQCFESNMMIPLFWYSYPVFCQDAKLLSGHKRGKIFSNWLYPWWF